jgi:hypothetical protein
MYIIYCEYLFNKKNDLASFYHEYTFVQTIKNKMKTIQNANTVKGGAGTSGGTGIGHNA